MTVNRVKNQGIHEMPNTNVESMSIISPVGSSDRDRVSGVLPGKLPLLISIVFLLCLLIMYAAQTGLGRWQVDEFLYFASHRDLGWRAYFERLYVSPRPLSELLIYVYGSAVLTFNQDFVPQALLVLWGGSLFGVGAAAYATLQRLSGRLSAAIALAISPMMFVIQTSPVTEMFYWPVATVAYLPAVAAITSLVFLLGDETGIVRRRGWCCTALLVSALSHEIGAAFSIGFGLASGALALLAAREKRRAPAVRDVVAALWWLIPALAGMAVMTGLVVFRSGNVDLGSDTKFYTGRLLASAGIAAWQVLIDVVTTSTFPRNIPGIVAAVLQKTVFAIGFALIWIRWGRVQPSRWHLALGIGIGGGIYFSTLAAYYHYGDLCCERHETARQWLIELLFILAMTPIVAYWSGRRQRLSRLDGWFGPLLLIASLLPVIVQVPGIRSDFQQLGMAQMARGKTWRSGLASGPQMQFYMPPDSETMMIHGTSIPVGTYDVAGKPSVTNDLVAGVGAFFGKTSVVACQAWQSGQSFLIDGRFIPACPPHAGPPDVVFNTR